MKLLKIIHLNIRYVPLTKFLLCIFCLITISCGQTPSKSSSSPSNTKQAEINTDKKVQQSYLPEQNTFNWISSFKEFRNAIYQADRQKVKTFIDFPILNEGNPIWYLANSGNDEALTLSQEAMKPFTEIEFDKYYNKIFPKTFINGILKIKTDELIKKGEFKTIKLKAGSHHIYDYCFI